LQVLFTTEQKLNDLNQQMRDLIIQADPQRNQNYSSPPPQESNGAPQADTITAQLDYLQKALGRIDSDYKNALQTSQTVEFATEEMIEELNQQIYNRVAQNGGQTDAPPPLTGKGTQDQLSYLERGITSIDQLFQSATLAAATKNASNQEKLEHFETVLMGLWQIIVSGEEEARTSSSGDEDDSDHSEDDISSSEEFSLQGFSAKVQQLYARVNNLKMKKTILHRQVMQQRELNSKSDAAKDKEFSELTEELGRTKELLEHAEQDATKYQEQLADVMDRLDEARQDVVLCEQERLKGESELVNAERESREASEGKLRAELQQRLDEVAMLEEKVEDIKAEAGVMSAETQSKLDDLGSKTLLLTEQLEAASQAKKDAEAAEAKMKEHIEAMTAEAQKTDGELREMEGELVRLQTELTVTKAELDGAYGTRAQRAAEVAANPMIKKEMDDLHSRNRSLNEELDVLRANAAASSGNPDLETRYKTLETELADTISEYESMTKATIETEKERESLENLIDNLRDRCENLEAQLSEEKVRSLGLKNTTPGGPASSESTSTTMLKNEFKKMMRDTRAEHVKALKVCCSHPDGCISYSSNLPIG
jgi:hypothetical protein